MTGVVHVPYAVAPWSESEEPSPAPEEVVEAHYDIHMLFEFSGTDQSCLLEKTTLAYDVTIDAKFEYVEEPYLERMLSDVQGAAAVAVATREPVVAYSAAANPSAFGRLLRVMTCHGLSGSLSLE